MTSLAYPENIHGHIFVSWLHPFKEHRLVVVGDKGMIRFEDSLEHKPLKVYEKGIDWIKGIPVNRNGPSELIQYETDLPLKVELNYFINHLDQRPKISNGQNGLEVVKILEDATNSMLGKV